MRDFIKNCAFVLFVAALFALLMRFLIALAPKLTEGVVVDKSYNPAYTTTHTSIVRSGNTAVPIIRDVHHAASWKIEVSGTDEEGEICVEWWTVGEAMYELIGIGDRVQRDPQTGVVSVSGRK